MRSNDLRKVIQTKLKTVCQHVYYKIADDDAMYPHIVYDLSSVNLGDLNRKDYSIDIDVWDKDEPYNAEDLADKVENLFNNANIPQTTILPTFFTENRSSVEDPDKKINHILIRVIAQSYER